MNEPPSNIDVSTVRDFGLEWQRFDQSNITTEERERLFSEYFGIFPWESLPPNAAGFDAGCGSGRWAALVAPRVGHLNCVDASGDALAVARRTLAPLANVSFHEAPLNAMPLKRNSMDFGYSLGVIHHIPDPTEALRACVATLKPGAPMLIYIYYAFDNRPAWFRMLWRVSDVMRRGISRMPFRLKSVLAEFFAALVYWPLARGARVAESFSVNVVHWPLSAYREHSYYSMRTDALDRFGTRLEHRMTRDQIRLMMEAVGLRDIRFSDSVPFWCAVGHRS